MEMAVAVNGNEYDRSFWTFMQAGFGVIKSFYEARKVLRTSKSEMQLKLCTTLDRILFDSPENSMESAKAFQTWTQSWVDGGNFCTRLHCLPQARQFKVSTRESMIENKVLPCKLSRFVCNLRRVLPVESSLSFPLWKIEQTKRGILLWEIFTAHTRLCETFYEATVNHRIMFRWAFDCDSTTSDNKRFEHEYRGVSC